MKSSTKLLLLTMLTVGLMMGYAPVQASPNSQNMKTIVIGGGDLNFGLVAQIMDAESEYILIETNTNVADIEEMVKTLTRFEVSSEHLLPYADLVDSPRIPNKLISNHYNSYKYPVYTKPKGASQLVYHNKLC